MNSTGYSFLEARQARIENGIVTDFGDPAAEIVAARDAAVVAPLCHLGVFDCSGADAKSFLHNQLTSDVNHLGAASAQHSAWCTAKGRMQASFVLFRNGDDYTALVSADLLQATLKRMQIFVLRAKVALADRSNDFVLLGIAGPGAIATLTAADLPVPAQGMQTESCSEGRVIRIDEHRFIAIVRSALAAQVWDKLAAHAVPVGASAWQWLDVQSGIPLITEATKEEFVPQMLGFEKIGGVSFHKGCYPGQEIVARAQYLGKVKRHLYRLRSAGPIQAGMKLFSADLPEQACGTIASAAQAPEGGYDALAVVQQEAAAKGTLWLEQAGGAEVSVVSAV